jgi:GntR family transcriptional regulator
MTESGFVPRYYEIEQSLRARIAGLGPDEPLPSDAMLVEEFGVSRMTARNAVQRLVQEGLVYRVPGRGTFVARAPAHRQAGKVLSFSDEMRRRGRVPRSRVLDRTTREPTFPEAQALQLGGRSRVVVVKRVRLADDEPVALEVAVLPDAVADVVLTAELEHESLHAALIRAGRVPTSGQAPLRAEPAAGGVAQLLDVRAGAALLVERRVIFDSRNRPLERTETRYVADRYGLDVTFEVEVAP